MSIENLLPNLFPGGFSSSSSSSSSWSSQSGGTSGPASNSQSSGQSGHSEMSQGYEDDYNDLQVLTHSGADSSGGSWQSRVSQGREEGSGYSSGDSGSMAFQFPQRVGQNSRFTFGQGASMPSLSQGSLAGYSSQFGNFGTVVWCAVCLAISSSCMLSYFSYNNLT